MSATCLAVGAATLMLAAPDFTLSWHHSVERTGWRESWSVTQAGLHLAKSAVRGSGAGMEPGPDAVLSEGWWVSRPDLTVEKLVLAASGATGGGWLLCAGEECRVIGAAAGEPVVLAPCANGLPAGGPAVQDRP